jgi:tetratricopeptide (TPR) repeat protein
VHDLLEARHHLLAAGDTEAAGQVTEWICTQLQTWGAWDQEASLIHDTLSRLPADSPRQAAWIQELGILAQNRGDYDEATRQYQRALDIFERLGNQARMASTYHQLGILAQNRGDYDEATRQLQRALAIKERVGNQVSMAITYSQLGVLEAKRGGPETAAIAWHMKALAIRLRLGIPQAVDDLRRLATYRSELGPERFTSLLTQATSDTGLAEAIASQLGQLDAADSNTADTGKASQGG